MVQKNIGEIIDRFVLFCFSLDHMALKDDFINDLRNVVFFG